jgi:hypothetical protein
LKIGADGLTYGVLQTTCSEYVKSHNLELLRISSVTNYELALLYRFAKYSRNYCSIKNYLSLYCYFFTKILNTLDRTLQICCAFSTNRFCCEFSLFFFYLRLNSMLYFYLLPTFTSFLIAFFNFLWFEIYYSRSLLRVLLLFLERLSSSWMCLFDPQCICCCTRRSLLSHRLGIWSNVYFILTILFFPNKD